MTQNSENEHKQSSNESAGNGLIARIVENWLTNANERSFQIPFCQVLSAEGEELIYIASHGVFEKGKDVITRLPDGTIRAYQMKGGNLKLKDWREIYGQMEDLVCLPVDHPSCLNARWHEPYLVTNGTVDDGVIDHINASNLGWEKRKLPEKLQLIHKHGLVERFVRLHGEFLPREAKDFQGFLALILADGKEPFDKVSYSSFAEKILSTDQAELSPRDASRAITSLLLLTSYILGARERSENHYAVFEGWTMACAYILETVERRSLADVLWSDSFKLGMKAANDAMSRLVAEVKERDSYGEQPVLVDGYFYRTRQLMLAGALASWILGERLEGKFDSTLQAKLERFVRQAFIWGEGASPQILLSAICIERCGRSAEAEGLIAQCLGFFAAAAQNPPGVPDPFISVEESVRFRLGVGLPLRDSFAGFSYAIPLMVEYLARRLRRRTLSRYWRSITRLSFHTSSPQLTSEWFRWNAPSANLMSHFAAEPQSWSVLYDEVTQTESESLPQRLVSNPRFFFNFLLVYPHRLTTQTLKALEKNCASL